MNIDFGISMFQCFLGYGEPNGIQTPCIYELRDTLKHINDRQMDDLPTLIKQGLEPSNQPFKRTGKYS